MTNGYFGLLIFMIIALFCCGFFLVGLLLLIHGIIKRKKLRGMGKKWPTVCIVLGVILLTPSVAGGSYFLVNTIIEYVKTDGFKFDPKTYDPKEGGRDGEYGEWISKEIVQAFDNKDADGIIEKLSKKTRSLHNISRQINYSLDHYKGHSTKIGFISTGGWFCIRQRWRI